MINKIGKKGAAADYLAFAIVIALCWAFFGLAIFSTHFIEDSIKITVTAGMNQANYEMLFLDVLKVKINDRIMADIMAEAYESNQYDAMAYELQKILSEHISPDTQWEIFFEDEKKKDNCSLIGCNGEKFSYEARIPLTGNAKTSVALKLNVYFSGKNQVVGGN